MKNKTMLVIILAAIVCIAGIIYFYNSRPSGDGRDPNTLVQPLEDSDAPSVPLPDSLTYTGPVVDVALIKNIVSTEYADNKAMIYKIDTKTMLPLVTTIVVDGKEYRYVPFEHDGTKYRLCFSSNAIHSYQIYKNELDVSDEEFFDEDTLKVLLGAYKQQAAVAAKNYLYWDERRTESQSEVSQEVQSDGDEN